MRLKTSQSSVEEKVLTMGILTFANPVRTHQQGDFMKKIPNITEEGL